MKLGKWTRVWLAAAPFLAGCAGFWQTPGSSSSGGGGCTSNCSTASSGYFYILNNGATPQLLGETISSGKLTAISGSPWTLLATPYAMALSPNDKFLYVSTTSGVYVYSISTGAVQSGSAVQISHDQAQAIAVDSTGKWLIEAIQGTGEVIMDAVPLNTSTGGANGVEAAPAGYPVNNAAVQNGKIAISPDDAHVFVALGSGGTIAVPFNVNTSAGNSPFSSTAPLIPLANSGGSALSVAVDPGGNLFYVGETLADSTGKTGGLRVFTLASLGQPSLVQAAGSPIASGGLAPNAILPASSGGEVYVANGQGTSSAGNLASFSITASGSSYTVTAQTTTASGTQPLSLAEDSSHTFVLAVNSSGSPYFSSYTFDSTTAGKLDEQVFANTGAPPLAIVAAQ